MFMEHPLPTRHHMASLCRPYVLWLDTQMTPLNVAPRSSRLWKLPRAGPTSLIPPPSSGIYLLQDLQVFHKMSPTKSGASSKAVFPSAPAHTELLEVHTLQAELIDSPYHPVPNVGLLSTAVGSCGDQMMSQ